MTEQWIEKNTKNSATLKNLHKTDMQQTLVSIAAGLHGHRSKVYVGEASLSRPILNNIISGGTHFAYTTSWCNVVNWPKLVKLMQLSLHNIVFLNPTYLLVFNLIPSITLFDNR